ncbi:epoxide hydrolase A [Cocos nucifera]|nr:epoxide hydrolase A [Cocos nucifera]
MHIAEKGEGPVVLLLHGFPELWYSWRHQILALSAAGYRAIAPDLRGFGDTDAPPDVSSYTMLHVVGDLVALIHTLGQEKEPGRAEAEFARIPTAMVMKKFLTYHDPSPVMVPKENGFAASPDKEITLPSWLSEEDINYFASKFDRNWELTAPWTGTLIKVPVKFIVGNQDLMYNVPGVKDYIHKGGFKKDVPFLEDVVVIEGAGHFINQEKPQEITDHIYEFIQKF